MTTAVKAPVKKIIEWHEIDIMHKVIVFRLSICTSDNHEAE